MEESGWYSGKKAGFPSQQPGFDSRPGNLPQKKIKNCLECPNNDLESQGVLKKKEDSHFLPKMLI